jgi:Flp pilus assembly protein TadD
MKTNTHTRAPSWLALTLLLISALDAQTVAPADQAAGLIRKNDLAAAEALLTPLTGESSADAAAFFQLGSLRLRQQRADDAATAYEKAAKLDPTKAEYFSQYVVALNMKMQGMDVMAQGALAVKMKKALEKSVALDPNHIPGLIGLARFYTNAPEIAGGSMEKAKEFAQRVHALNPLLGELELAIIAERDEDFATALRHVDAASKLQPTQAGPHATAGRMLAKLGRTDEARIRLQHALELDPKHEAARKALAALSP